MDRREENVMKYSSWKAFLYSSSAFKDMGEGLAGLERTMRLVGVEPPPGDVRIFENWVKCVPGYNCTIAVSELERALRQLARTAESSFGVALRVIAVAKANGIRRFDVRLSGPVGPAPDSEGRATRAKRAVPRRPMPGRPRPKRPRPRAKRRPR
jgi:hypothetical protein